MLFNERLKEARLNKGLTQNEVAEALNVTNAAVSNYEKGYREPTMLYISKIMELLDVDANYLFQDGIDLKESESYSFKEQDIIKKYRAIDTHGKKNVNNILDNEYDRCNSVEDETTPYLVQPYYTIGASAGNGEYLFDDLEQSEILLPDTLLNRKSDFIIDVKGSSMEPTYFNGDKLLVAKQDELNIGDIGIFIINGESFVKELGNGELISHNNNYQNISLNEFDNIKTIGKVIGKLN